MTNTPKYDDHAEVEAKRIELLALLEACRLFSLKEDEKKEHHIDKETAAALKEHFTSATNEQITESWQQFAKQFPRNNAVLYEVAWIVQCYDHDMNIWKTLSGISLLATVVIGLTGGLILIIPVILTQLGLLAAATLPLALVLTGIGLMCLVLVCLMAVVTPPILFFASEWDRLLEYQTATGGADAEILKKAVKQQLEDTTTTQITSKEIASDSDSKTKSNPKTPKITQSLLSQFFVAEHNKIPTNESTGLVKVI